MANIKGRDPSQNTDDREKSKFRQYEEAIFLKHGLEPDSTAVAIREKSIGLHTKEGNVGIIINDTGNVLIQGKPVFKVSGKNIIKGNYTENDQSWVQNTGIGGSIGGSTGIAIPHTHLHRHSVKPAYLYRWPSVSMISGIKKMLAQFQKLF